MARGLASSGVRCGRTVHLALNPAAIAPAVRDSVAAQGRGGRRKNPIGTADNVTDPTSGGVLRCRLLRYGARLTASLAISAGLTACAAGPSFDWLPPLGGRTAALPGADIAHLPSETAPAPAADLAHLAALPPASPPAAAQLLGKTPAEVADLLGSPSFTRNELPAKIWQYAAHDCVLFLYFYNDRAAHDDRLLHLDSRNPDDMRKAPVQHCLAAVMRRPPAVSALFPR